MNPETEANWRTLAQIAVEDQNITVAEHCNPIIKILVRKNITY